MVWFSLDLAQSLSQSNIVTENITIDNPLFWVLVLSAVGFLFFVVFVFFSNRSLPYHKVPLFTASEGEFLRVLQSTVGDRYFIFGKVRIADLVLPRKTLILSNYKKHFYPISSKHLDFVLIDKKTLLPVVAIELNDKSHQRRDRKKRDIFVKSVCLSAELPLAWIEVKKKYTHREIIDSIAEARDMIK